MTNVSLYANARARIRRNIATILPRDLNGIGQIRVAVNQEVTPTDIVGEFQVPSGFFSLNIAQRFKISPAEAKSYLQKQIGARVYKGELLALKNSLFGRLVVVSPTDGTFDRYDETTGQLFIKFFPKIVSLPAGVYGIVVSVDQTLGRINIKTQANELIGVLGSGRGRMGSLTVVSNQSTLTQGVSITKDFKSQILVAGALIDQKTIQKAFQLGVAGIIAGGIDHSTYLALQNVTDQANHLIADNGISVVVTEGFGPLPIETELLKMLNAGREMISYINGNTTRILLPTGNRDSIINLRKVALPFQDEIQTPPKISAQEIKVGQHVRIIWPPFMGAVAKILAIDNTPTLLESGLKTYLLTVETASRKLKVPYLNVEIVD